MIAESVDSWTLCPGEGSSFSSASAASLLVEDVSVRPLLASDDAALSLPDDDATSSSAGRALALADGPLAPDDDDDDAASPLRPSVESLFARLSREPPVRVGRFVATGSESWDLFAPRDSPRPTEARGGGARPEPKRRGAAAVGVIALAAVALAAVAVASRPATLPAAGALALRPATPPAASALAFRPASPTDVVTVRPAWSACAPAFAVEEVIGAGLLGGAAFFVGVPYVPGLLDNAILGVAATLGPLVFRNWSE